MSICDNTAVEKEVFENLVCMYAYTPDGLDFWRENFQQILGAQLSAHLRMTYDISWVYIFINGMIYILHAVLA